MKSENGFTLLELLITIGVIGILGAIAIKNSQGVYSSFKVKGAARQVYSDMQMARLSAIKRGHTWCVIFNGSTFTSYVVVDSGANGVCDPGVDVVDAAGEKSVDISSAYSGVTMTHNFSAAPANTLNFNPDGSAKAGTVTLTSGTRTLLVTVNKNTGSVSIQ